MDSGDKTTLSIEQGKTTLSMSETTLDMALDALTAEVTEEEMNPLTGLTFKYVLGEGGMGTVYLAQQQLPRREVAVKRARHPSPQTRWLLLHEAVVTGMLEHPVIVPIHQITQREDEEYEVVMKRIQGKTLSSYIYDVPEVDVDWCIEQLIQVCNAVEYAHSRSVVHRDIKSENIMIGEFGEVYLLDWGIAVHNDEGKIHFPRALVGTPTMIAPEMLSGDPYEVDARTDVYLLGGVLYEILKREPIHMCRTMAEAQQKFERREPLDLSVEIPAPLQKIIRQACAFAPMDRMNNVRSFREALQDYLDLRQVYQLFETGQRHHQKFESLLTLEDSEENLVRLYAAFHQARFAYEQAIQQGGKATSAYDSLSQLVEEMSQYLLDRERFTAANFLLESTNMGSEKIKTLLRNRLLEEEVKEQERVRLAEIGRSFDPVESLQARLVLGSLVVVMMALVSFVLSQYEEPSTNAITTDSLFLESSILVFPFVLVIVWKRSALWYNANGRRATIGIAGSLMCIFLHRWVAFEYQLDSAPVIFTDTFIISLGFANATPAIPSGLHIAILCFALGCLTVFFPGMFWWTSLLMIIFIAVSIGLDIVRERRRLQTG